ncbi:V-type ATP synthase subunit E [Peptoniphilus catoniae]|uniref:V-type ATP synthase subunit E n=1 Tax=Peptoniphilus catoniae TaxID=1660341 RepID=UPI0015D62268|nr:V-type ATP synthase subunit E family protein [Peptoniphilus catoniae]
MSNIDNIIDKIKSDSDIAAQDIIENAREEAKKLLEDTEKNAKLEAENIIKNAEEEAKNLESKIIENAKLKARDNVLFNRNKMVDRIFDLAREKFHNLTEDEYIKYLEIAFKKVGDENALVTVADRYKDAVSKKTDLNLSDKSLDEGFLIETGDITYNGNFNELVDMEYYRFDKHYFKELFND